MGKTYFIGDLHFGHENILSFDNRPFRDIKKHDQYIIDHWNKKVGIEDEVWILGDISWYNSTETIEIIRELNGIKHLCKGNHDNKILKNRELQKEFIEICDYKEIETDKGKGIVLCHYPIPCFKNHFYGWYHLYAHVHTSFEYKMMERNRYEMEELYGKESKMYNVGCMLPYMSYEPKTLKEIEDGYDMSRYMVINSNGERIKG